MPSTVEITKNVFAKKGGEEGLRTSMLNALVKVMSQAKALTPVDQGQLKNSIMMRLEQKDSGFNGRNTTGFESDAKTGDELAPDDQQLTLRPGRLEGYVGTNSDHWYPEFGTRFQIAQPFLRPAKELVMTPTRVAEIAKKYCRAKMQEEFNNRKIKKVKRG